MEVMRLVRSFSTFFDPALFLGQIAEFLRHRLDVLGGDARDAAHVLADAANFRGPEVFHHLGRLFLVQGEKEERCFFFVVHVKTRVQG